MRGHKMVENTKGANRMMKIKKLIQQLSNESFKMLIPYTLIILAISFVNMIFFQIIVNNLFKLIAYTANVDVISTGTLSTVLSKVYTYPLFVLLFSVIGIAIFMQYIFLINVLYQIYISSMGTPSEKVFSKKRMKIIFLTFIKKIRIVPVLIYFFYFVLLLSLFGINIENAIVDRINVSDVITSFILANPLYTVFYIMFKAFLLFLIARLTPFIFMYALKDYNQKESFEVSGKILLENSRKIFLFLLVIFIITAGSDLYSYFIGDKLFYDIYANGTGVHFSEVLLFIVSLPILVVDEFVTILFLIYFIHIFFDDDEIVDIENTKFSKLSHRKAYKGITIVILLALIFSEVITYRVSYESTDKRNLIMVHRGGGNEVFENTRESIEYSMLKNYPAIEIDTMELKDGEIILIHDKTLSRIADENISVGELSLEDMKSRRMIGGYEFITLDEALDLVLTDDIIVNIEIKYHGNETENYVSNIVEKVTSRSLENRVYISSFNYENLLEIESLNEDIRTMYFSFFLLGNLTNLKVDAVGLDITYLSNKQFNILHKSGYDVAIFTVNKKKDMLSSLSFDLNYIISDEPESLEDLINGLNDIFQVD